MHSLAKRQMEDQWILLEVITNLPPNVPQLQRIKDEIEQLLHNNMVVDTHGRLDLYTKRGLEFIQSVKENPKVHEQMQKVSEEFQESASTALAGILSKTGKKLLHSTVHYFFYIPFLVKLYGKWKGQGLFAALHHSINTAVGMS